MKPTTEFKYGLVVSTFGILKIAAGFMIASVILTTIGLWALSFGAAMIAHAFVRRAKEMK